MLVLKASTDTTLYLVFDQIRPDLHVFFGLLEPYHRIYQAETSATLAGE